MRNFFSKQSKLWVGATGLLLFSSVGFAQVQFSGTSNTGSVASAIGSVTTASGSYSTAMGRQTIASGSFSTALGFRTKAEASFSFASGAYTTASGDYSFASGKSSTASGNYSLASGQNTIASGNNSFALGTLVSATVSNAMVIGTGVGGGLVNSTANSLMVGFNSTIPTLFVSAGTGANTIGKVGIGTTNTPTTISGINISAYSLFVKGGILTEEVRVQTGWADYVFDSDYQLSPLKEVEQYIQANGHLPNVPSEEQVLAQGLEIGEITKIQQEKIEELTLYLIDLQKQLDELKLKLD